ncbi:MAG: ribosome small subunit-dependent GTPase A [Erysipelotrichaceae bacterium]
MHKGTIIKNISNQYLVLLENGEQVNCVAMGKLRKKFAPLVGDEVLVEQFESQYGIQEIKPRRNHLIRPSIANVDQALIVMSAIEPAFSTTLIDRILFQVTMANITPVIVVTKMDLVDEPADIMEAIADYRKSGYEVIIHGIGYDDEPILAILKDKISVLTGQSGAGKSSLLNRIDPTFSLHTQEISKALGRGKHTTRHCELHFVKTGWVGDTPGFSSLDFEHFDCYQLAGKLLDFKDYHGTCRFADCMHINEPDCAVKQAVAQGEVSAVRYEHYVEIEKISKMSKAALHRRLK